MVPSRFWLSVRHELASERAFLSFLFLPFSLRLIRGVNSVLTMAICIPTDSDQTGLEMDQLRDTSASQRDFVLSPTMAQQANISLFMSQLPEVVSQAE